MSALTLSEVVLQDKLWWVYAALCPFSHSGLNSASPYRVIENYTEVSSTGALVVPSHFLPSIVALILSEQALWIIDFLQTLPMEIEAVWSRTLTGTKILFLLNRYSFALYLFGTLRIILPGAVSNDG